MARCHPWNPWLSCQAALPAKNYSRASGSGLIVALPGFQSAGQTSPCLRGELGGLQDAQRLVHGTADRQVVDGDVTDHPFRIDQEQTAQGDALVEQHAVVAGDLFVEVGEDGDLELADPALAARRVPPGEVRVDAVDRRGDEIGAQRVELGGAGR